MVDQNVVLRKIILLEEYLQDPTELTEQLKKMAQFRNIVVHDYLRIQPEIVYAILTKNIGDIREFAKTIKNKYLTV